MRAFKNKNCLICNKLYIPKGSSSKYCSDECAVIVLKSKQKEYQETKKKKRGRKVGIGSGGLTGFGKDNFNYKNGIGIFQKIRKDIKQEVRYCERCNIDLKDADRYHWCVHHIDHDRTNNERHNLELLCKRCHQIEHECVKAFEGVETNCRHKRVEAHTSEN